MRNLTQRAQLHHKILLPLMAVFMLAYTSTVRAETTECTVITTIPMVITVQGVYCLKSNLTTNITFGNAIEIQTNNVTIDFNNFKLGGLAAGPVTEAYGVYAEERQNITLRNGNIRGFYRGIHLDSTDSNYTNDGGHVIENSRFDRNTYAAMWIEGSGNIIRGNQISKTGGIGTANPFAYGIITYGPGVEVINNKIDGTLSDAFGDAFGIYVRFADSPFVMQNRISRTEHSGGTRTSTAIRHVDGARGLFQENAIINSDQIGTTAIDGFSQTESFCRNRRQG